MPKQLPQNIEAEQALIGSMLLYPETVRKAFEENLHADDFFLESNKKIYSTIVELNNQGNPTDLTSVITRLSDNNLLDQAGGAEYITQLVDVSISSFNSEYYITLIQEKARLRALVSTCDEIKQQALDNAAQFDEVMNTAEKTISEITRDRKTSAFVTSKEMVDSVIANINYLQQHRGMTGVPSGFPKLDHITNGFQNSDLIILAARPSVGKTALALNFALNAAVDYGKSVALFSLEMPVIQLGNRLLACRSGVSSYKIKNGFNITRDDWGLINNAKANLQQASIFVDDTSGITMSEIFAKCRKLKAEGTLDIIIIDYLQLITPAKGKANGSREQEVAEISRSLKGLARELDVPVMALSQLSRSVEKENRGTPSLSDLRESGAIEQDADMIVFISRVKKEYKDDEEKPDKFSDDYMEDRIVSIAKHRNGAVGEIQLTFQGSINKFYTKIDEDEDED